MKTFKIFSMAAVALCLAACSNSDDYSVQMPTQSADVLHFEAAVAAPNADATMRTVYTEDGGNIKVKWEENDEIAAVVTNSEGKYAKTVLTVSKVNTDGSATISGDITKPKDGKETVDLIYPADIVTVVNDGSDYHISFMKMSNGTLDGTLESITNNIDYRMADDCALTVSGDKATLTSAAKLESKLSIWKLTLKKEDNSSLSASKVTIGDGTGVMASATLASAASEVYLPVLVDAMSADIVISATEGSDNYYYLKKNVTLAAKKYYRSTVQMTKGAHLALLTADYVAKDGEILTGTLASNVKISIADGATVTLKDANINGGGTLPSGNYAGITCVGDATINLEGTNTVKGFSLNNPGIYVPDGKTLTIQGSGSLDATGRNMAAGIGGGKIGSCGNIVIKGGNITATGGVQAAGIGGGFMNGTCGTITITSGVTSVKATAGSGAQSIGCGLNGQAISVTIGGTVYATGISTSPFEYSPIPATAHALSASVVGDVVDTDGNAYTLDATHALPSGVTAVGIVGKVTGTGHGLILALHDATAQTWNTINGWTSVTTYAGTTLKVLPDDAARGSLTSYTTLGATAVSNWAVAQKSDYEAIFQNLGSTTGDSDGKTYDGNVNAYITTGVGGDAIDGSYWSATEYNSSLARYFGGGCWDGGSKSGSNSVRPVLGF